MWFSLRSINDGLSRHINNIENRERLYKKLKVSKVVKLRKNDKEARFKLFNNSKAFKDILAFLNVIKSGFNQIKKKKKERI